MNRPHCRLLFLVFVTLAVAPWPVAAQTAVTLTWDEPAPSEVTGYRVSLDGVWHDYGVTPVAAGGACTCSVALNLAVGPHTVIVGAYNAGGEALSEAFSYTVTAAPATPVAPVAPSSPSPAIGATGASTSPTLTWSASGATTYEVKLDTANPPATVVAESLPSASYQRMLTASTNYFWQVVAHNSTGTTVGPVWSFMTTSAPVTGAIPAPWTNHDIGDVGVAGSTTFTDGTFTVTGGGLDIWGAADAFQYVFQPLAGDGEIVARVTTLQNSHGNAKAGVMLRGAATASAQHVMLNSAVDGSVELIVRTSAGTEATYIAGAMQARPIWLKLARAGALVTAAVSYDGQAWSVLGSASVDGLGYAGLAVTSGAPSVPNTSTFDSVAVSAAGRAGPTNQ
jgi:hypothetical protein